MVPGPAMSARTFTMEKAPLRMPKPRPDTATWQTNTCHQPQCYMVNKHLPSTSVPHGKQTSAINITITWQSEHPAVNIKIHPDSQNEITPHRGLNSGQYTCEQTTINDNCLLICVSVRVSKVIKKQNPTPPLCAYRKP